MTLIIDSFAWVEFLSAGKGGPRVREVIESSEELVTPDLVLAEVARVFSRQGFPLETIAGHLRSIGALSSVRPVSIEIALETIESDRRLRGLARSKGLGQPSFADCIVLSFARGLNGRVVTADRHFQGLRETVWIGD